MIFKPEEMIGIKRLKVVRLLQDKVRNTTTKPK